MRINELILYKHMEEGKLLWDMTFLMENYDNTYYNSEDFQSSALPTELSGHVSKSYSNCGGRI